MGGKLIYRIRALATAQRHQGKSVKLILKNGASTDCWPVLFFSFAFEAICRARRGFTYHTSSVAGAVLRRFCSLLRSRVGQIAGSARLSSRDIENASCLFAVKCFKLTGNWRTIHHTAFETIAPLFFTKGVQTLSIQLHLGLGRVCQ